MAIKRKRDTQQPQNQPKEEVNEVEEDPEEEPEEESEEEDDGENEGEEEDEEEQEQEEEEEEEEGEGEGEGDEEVKERDDGDESFEELLKPFHKEKLIYLLSEAARKHSDVADHVHNLANEDPAHRKIFVHGLSWDATTEHLVNTFKSYGEIEDCKVILDKTKGTSKGYGFVLYKTRSGARKALLEPQKLIGSRKASCQLASTGPATAATIPALPVSEYTQRKIFVSNVAAELDPQKVLKFFSQYGEIEEGPLGLDKKTGKPKGFCLFVYKTVASAKKALEVPQKIFEGHTLICKEAIDGLKQSKLNLNSQNPLKAHTTNFQKKANTGLHGPSQFMAPAASSSPYNQGAPSQAFNPALGQGLNPAVGQALTTLLGLNNLLGTLGTAGVGAGGNPVAPGQSLGLQSLYGNQAVGGSVSSGQAGYSNQQIGINGMSSSQVGYSNQQSGQGGPGWSQHGYMGGAPPPY